MPKAKKHQSTTAPQSKVQFKKPPGFFAKHRIFFEVILLLLVAWCALGVPPLKADDPATQVTSTAAKVSPKLPNITPGQVIADVPYCNDQKLDIYQPRKILYERTPVVMYLHGGGWKTNTKSSEPGQLSRIDGLRDDGFAVVSIDYRKIPDYYYPAPIEDTLCAIRFLRAKASAYHFDKSKFAAYGFSAGGHLAAMAGVVDGQFNNGQYASESSKLQAVVTLAAYFDFQNGLYPRNPAVLERFMHGDVDLQEASPISYVNKNDAAFLLIHGLDDLMVPPAQSELFSEALNKAGVKNQLLLVQNAEHGLGQTIDPTQPSLDEVVTRMHEFIKDELKIEP